MRGRWPTISDCRRTLLAICQSTAFLTTNAFAYCMFLCIIRKYAGGFNFYTFSFVPALLASLAAILIERPSRRAMLAIYTSNVASETLFNMAVVRGIVRPVRGGSCMLFGASAAAMLYIYRLGADAAAGGKSDSIFEVLRFVVGEGERRIGRPLSAAEPMEHVHRTTASTSRQSSSSVNVRLVLRAVQTYAAFVRHVKSLPRHRTCPHRDSCVYYGVHGGARLFGVGLAIQVALKCVLQAKNTWRRGPGHLVRGLAQRDTIKLGVFLGGFAGVYRVSGFVIDIRFMMIDGVEKPSHLNLSH